MSHPPPLISTAGALGGTPISRLFMFNNRYDPELTRHLGRDAQQAVRTAVRQLEDQVWRLVDAEPGSEEGLPFECMGKTVDLTQHHIGRCGVLLFVTKEEAVRRRKLRLLRARLEAAGDAEAVELLEAVEPSG